LEKKRRFGVTKGRTEHQCERIRIQEGGKKKEERRRKPEVIRGGKVVANSSSKHLKN